MLFLLFNVYMKRNYIHRNILNEEPWEMEFAVFFKDRQVSLVCNYKLFKKAKASITNCLNKPKFYEIF